MLLAVGQKIGNGHLHYRNLCARGRYVFDVHRLLNRLRAPFYSANDRQVPCVRRILHVGNAHCCIETRKCRCRLPDGSHSPGIRVRSTCGAIPLRELSGGHRRSKAWYGSLSLFKKTWFAIFNENRLLQVVLVDLLFN